MLHGGKIYGDRITQTLNRISGDPGLSQAVRCCTLSALGPSVLDSAIVSFRSFPNLSDISLSRVSIDKNQLDQLLISIDKHPFSIKMLDVNIMVRKSSDVAQRLVYHLNGPLPRFTSLSIVNNIHIGDLLPLLVYWTSTPTLEHLRFLNKSDVTTSLLNGHCTSSIPFPRLKTLRLSNFWNIDTKCFELMPMLEELYIFRRIGGRYTKTIDLPKGALPRLRHYQGSDEHVQSLVPGRPIRSLTLFSHRYLSVSMLNFGSLTPIRSLTFMNTPDPLEALEIAVLSCPALQELTMRWHYRRTLSPVCDFLTPKHRLTTDMTLSFAFDRDRPSSFVTTSSTYVDSQDYVNWFTASCLLPQAGLGMPGKAGCAKYWSRAHLISGVWVSLWVSGGRVILTVLGTRHG